MHRCSSAKSTHLRSLLRAANEESTVFSTFSLTCVFFFFFSSRRRHTRSLCDWSSDVCSSDLVHLSLDELELGDLAFGLAVRPRLDQGSMDRGDVFGDPRNEGADQAVACGGNQIGRASCRERV